MAHALIRTASMAIGKKAPSGSKGNSKLQVHRVVANPGGGRRHTMLPQNPQPRDSVLSNGSSDRSSSVSDEALLVSPTIHMPGSYGNGYNFEEQLQEAWPIKCCFVVKEIMQTEIAYVQALADIIKGYLTPLYSHLLSSGESPNFIKTVFSNIVKIHQSHQELLEVFQESFVSPHDFGSSFLNMDFLSLYSVYCTSFSQGNECLEKSLHENQHLAEFITLCQHGLGHSLPLSSQLIKPVQRILKYRLLLEELNKHFDQQHPICSTIQEALEKMSSVAEQINTSFSNQKQKSKGVPSAVAKRRTNQLRDLQNSRSSKGRRERGDSSSSTSPMHRGLNKRSISETHLHFPSGPWGAKPEPTDNRSVLPQQRSLKEKVGLVDSLPNVKSLKNYFEKLNQEGEEESRRGSCAVYTATGMKKAKSMAGTRKDSISSVGLDHSPVWSPTWSPTKSPIKVPVLPHSPRSSPTKFPTSPHKSPTKHHPSLPSPKHPSLASPKCPSLPSPKHSSLPSPKRPSLASPKCPSLSRPSFKGSPPRKNSWGSTSDLRSNTEGSYGGVPVGRSAKVMETEIDVPTTSPASSSKSNTVSKISTEIMRCIALQSAQPNSPPRTMV